MDWLVRVKKRVFLVSQEKSDITKALAEWRYSGEVNDLGLGRAECELCGKADIRFQFEIINTINSNQLLIGSECITRFGPIQVIDEKGQAVLGAKVSQKIARDKRRVISQAKIKKALNILIELARKDSQFKLDHIAGYYEAHTALHPRFLNFVLWRLEVSKVPHDKKLFKLKIRTKNEQTDLLVLEDWKVKRMWECLSSDQKKWYKARRSAR